MWWFHVLEDPTRKSTFYNDFLDHVSDPSVLSLSFPTDRSFRSNTPVTFETDYHHQSRYECEQFDVGRFVCLFVCCCFYTKNVSFKQHYNLRNVLRRAYHADALNNLLIDRSSYLTIFPQFVLNGNAIFT